MSTLQLIGDVLARLVWLRDEPDPADREIALRDLENDIRAWLAENEDAK